MFCAHVRHHIIKHQNQTIINKLILQRPFSKVSKTPSYSDIFRQSINVSQDTSSTTPKRKKIAIKTNINNKDQEVDPKLRNDDHSLYFYNIREDIPSLEKHDANDKVIFNKSKKKKKKRYEDRLKERVLAEKLANSTKKKHRHRPTKSQKYIQRMNDFKSNNGKTTKNDTTDQIRRKKIKKKKREPVKALAKKEPLKPYNPNSLVSIFQHKMHKANEEETRLQEKKLRQANEDKVVYCYGYNRKRNIDKRLADSKSSTSINTFMKNDEEPNSDEDIDVNLKLALQSIFNGDIDPKNDRNKTKRAITSFGDGNKLDIHKYISSRSNTAPAFKIR